MSEIEIYKKALFDNAESTVRVLNDIISERFDEILKMQLENWKINYPKYKFSAYCGHNMLVITTNKTIVDENLQKEIDAFIDWHCTLEWKISTCDFERIE